MNMPTAFADLFRLDEDDRIQVIGHYVMHERKTAAICVDDVPGKPERYIRKLKARFPGIVCSEPVDGPVASVKTIRCSPPEHANTSHDRVN